MHSQPTAMADVIAFTWSCDAPYTTVKERFVIGRVERGHGRFRAGARWQAGPGSLHLAQPGDTHCVTPLAGPLAIRVVALPAWRAELPLERHLEPGDPRGVPVRRVLDAVWTGAPRLALEVALAELAGGVATLAGAPTQYGRPVSRALDAIRDSFDTQLTLDQLAADAGVDRFRLCREFRARLGISPYAYLTRIRIARAKQLLARGMTATAVATAVGFCDQSQLARHFRRLVGTTPGRFRRDGAR